MDRRRQEDFLRIIRFGQLIPPDARRLDIVLCFANLQNVPTAAALNLSALPDSPPYPATQCQAAQLLQHFPCEASTATTVLMFASQGNGIATTSSMWILLPT